MKLSKENKVFAGVCSGLAKEYNIDPAYIRLGFVIGSLFTGIPVLAYLVLAFTMEKG